MSRLTISLQIASKWSAGSLQRVPARQNDASKPRRLQELYGTSFPELRSMKLCATREEEQVIYQQALQGYAQYKGGQSIDIVAYAKANGSDLTERQLAAHAKLATVLQHYINDPEFRFFYDLIGEECARGAPEDFVGWHGNPVNPLMMRHWMDECVSADGAAKDNPGKHAWLEGLKNDPERLTLALMEWQGRYAKICQVVVEFLDVQAEAKAAARQNGEGPGP